MAPLSFNCIFRPPEGDQSHVMQHAVPVHCQIYISIPPHVHAIQSAVCERFLGWIRSLTLSKVAGRDALFWDNSTKDL
jgi:hypothetical protein